MPKDVGESGVRTRSAESLRAQYIIRFSAFLCTKSHIYSMLCVHLLYTLLRGGGERHCMPPVRKSPNPTVTACRPLIVCSDVNLPACSLLEGLRPSSGNSRADCTGIRLWLILRQGRALPLRVCGRMPRVGCATHHCRKGVRKGARITHTIRYHTPLS